MNILIFLVVFPLLIAFILLSIPSLFVRRIIAVIANVVLCVVPIYLLVVNVDRGASYYSLSGHMVSRGMFFAEVAMGVVILVLSWRARKYLAALLVAIQSTVMIGFELVYGHDIQVEHRLFVDNFSLIMAMIIGIIGSAICLYAIGYITEFHEHHQDTPNRRRYFFFLMYLFLSAMFGVVFSNDLLWLFFFWELTTLCSFLLIRYKNDTESNEAAFRALTMNLVGGLAFAVGIVYLFVGSGTLELDKLMDLDKAYALLPAVCIAFAGLAKSAQFPFSSWLTGAMVAPTPVSALLHSSTMVKAGVYAIIRVAPVLEGTTADKMLTLIGGVSFLATSLIAISQSNAKKVLAYSTISNLGLIVACAGVNSYSAVWSAILLIIFHAVAKSLLFLCVGVIEHKLGSRDIEDMDHLIVRLPRLTAVMVIGMAGMFLAPFGMVISKFATIKAFVNTNPWMAIILAYGSAATLYYWVKWMGKVISIKYGEIELKEHWISTWEWITLTTLAVATVAVCLAFPLISFRVIDPFIKEVYRMIPSVDPFAIQVILVIMVGLLIILPLGLFYYAVVGKQYKRVGTYLGGANVDNVTFEGAMARRQSADLKNYYLEKYFGENVLFDAGIFLALAFVLVMFGVVML